MDQESIIKLHKECSIALKKLNDKLQESNISYDIPTINLVNIPSGYIRPVLSFANSYQLRKVIKNQKLVSNIYYSFQYLEYLKYINKTFAITLGIRTLFFKYSIIHIYSIYEGILSGVNDSLRVGCEECKKHASCPHFIPKSKYKTHEKILELLENKVKISLEFVVIFNKFKKSRDLVHIHTIGASEHQNEKYELMLIEGYRGLNILKNELVTKVFDYEKIRNCKCFNSK